jgi:hypothetical protein
MVWTCPDQHRLLLSRHLGEAQVPVLLARPSAAQTPSFQASPSVDQASVV